MKLLTNLSYSIKTIIAVLILSLSRTLAWAQEKSASVDINVNKGGGWYTQPWVWIVGGAVFLLLLVALLRGNSNRD